MVLVRKFTNAEVLEIVMSLASDTLPEKAKGTLQGSFTDDGIEVFFVQASPEITASKSAKLS